jgi:hypothetical protein
MDGENHPLSAFLHSFRSDILSGDFLAFDFIWYESQLNPPTSSTFLVDKIPNKNIYKLITIVRNFQKAQNVLNKNCNKST